MNIFRKKLKVGQFWAIKSDNPFKKPQSNVEILDIKKGYVLSYSRWNWEREEDKWLPDVGEISYRKSQFRFLFNELVKDVEEL